MNEFHSKGMQNTSRFNDELSSSSDISIFVPLTWSMTAIRDAIPPHLFVRDEIRGLRFLARDILLACIFFWCAFHIDEYLNTPAFSNFAGSAVLFVLRGLVWCTYWILQGFTFTGIWVIGHECGHGAFSSHRRLCDVLGYTLHTFLLTPYFSWIISHHRHHMNHASMEFDEPYIPKNRSDLKLPAGDTDIDYEEYFGDTPIYTLFILVRQQLLAFPAYLLYNASGQKRYPMWTNHFNPNCVLFTREQRSAVLKSNMGIVGMIFALKWACTHWSLSTVFKYYAIPWLFVNHWFVMITYLQHTDPDLPHYRAGQWNFQRGAAATMDREFLGFIGHFFFHDVAHFHVVHHFFPKMPFYHGREATQHLRKFIGEHYHHSDKPVFKALWENYNDCQFVEDDGDIVFYKNRRGCVLYGTKSSGRGCSDMALNPSLKGTPVHS